jgi:antitoxin HicB
MSQKTRFPYAGSDFEEFLRSEGRLDEATAIAVKRVLAWQLEREMKRNHVTRSELARRMRTSRAVVHRLLDRDDPAVTLATISRAAAALGKTIRLRLAA